MFQSINYSSNPNCNYYYSNGNFFDSLGEINNLKQEKTWTYSPEYGELDIQYASLYASANNMNEVCPGEYKSDYSRLLKKFKVFFNALKQSKVNPEDICIFEIAPESFLVEFAEIKNRITEHCFFSFEKPENYFFLLEVNKLLLGIEKTPLNIGDKIPPIPQQKFILERANQSNGKIRLNLFGTKTGRFSEKSHSFPILTLPFEARSIISPRNNWFLELDFNAAELRTALSLSNTPQPEEDLHEWVRDHIFCSKSLSRESSKRKIISWLYDPSNKNAKAEKVFNRNLLLEEYRKTGKLKTPFGKVIEADEEHALNYLLQATANEVALERTLRIRDCLIGRKSFVAWTMHDSVIVDLNYEDRDLIPKLRDIYSDTFLGRFRVKASLGKDFGNMRLLR